MKPFRFVVLGAGNITARFCDAVDRIEGCQIEAVASKSLERAKTCANKNQIPRYYDSYEEMLKEVRPDGAYIAVTPNDHFRLTMLCLEYGVPVLCEKAMFQNGKEARCVFAEAKKKDIFVMEALWSRFLPAVNKVREWVSQERIGKPEIVQTVIGFLAPQGRENRYHNPKLGGGAAKDITVYAYELTTYILNQEIKKVSVSAKWGDTGVDLINQISIEFQHTLANLFTTFSSPIEEQMVLYGKEGKIVLSNPHFASECYLYKKDGELAEHFVDNTTENGFTYEIEEAIGCIGAGKIESEIVPHRITTDCADLFDKIEETRCLPEQR